MIAAHSERGQVLPLIAVCLAVLMLFAGLAVDVGYWSYQQRQQQNAADAAALGGAQALLAAGCSGVSAAQTAGQHDAQANGYTNGSGGVSVTINSPSVVGRYAGQSCSVSAVVTNTKVNRFFTGMLGQEKTIPVSTQAVATLISNNNGCIFLMDPTKTFQLNGVNINAPTCGIMADSSMVQTNGGTVTIAGFGYSQSLQNNATSFPKATPQKIPTFADPCAEITGCAYLAANPEPTTGCTSYQLNGGTGSINAGPTGVKCFSQIQVNGGSLTMGPGIYVMTGIFQQNGGTVVGSNVTFYNAPGGSEQFNGSSEAFTPENSGPTAGVLVYQVPSNTNIVQFNGGSNTLSGLVYAPGATGQVNGTGGQYAVMVFGTMQFNGTNTADYSGPTTGNSLIKNPTLAQ
jgi:hypothetical protein